MPIRLLHRPVAVGGLSGAVLEGIAASSGDWCVVMDGDLQHPPDLIPALVETGEATGAEVVVASRHRSGGSARGLDGWRRHLVSASATVLTRAMFPIRLRNCTDPMSGFFAVRRDRIRRDLLHPRGFKILLEILAHHSLRVVEEPFVFAPRHAGETKASAAEGLNFLVQLTRLRFGRLSRYATIGAAGAVLNLAIMAVLEWLGCWYVVAAIVGAATTIVVNFILQELFVFHDLRNEGRGLWSRLARSLAFNASETAVRTTLLWVIVECTIVPSLLAQAALLGIGFLARFVYHARVVYRARRTAPLSPILPDELTTEPDSPVESAEKPTSAGR